MNNLKTNMLIFCLFSLISLGYAGTDKDALKKFKTSPPIRAYILGTENQIQDFLESQRETCFLLGVAHKRVERQNGRDSDGNGYIDDVNGWNFYNFTPFIGSALEANLSLRGTFDYEDKKQISNYYEKHDGCLIATPVVLPKSPLTHKTAEHAMAYFRFSPLFRAYKKAPVKFYINSNVSHKKLLLKHILEEETDFDFEIVLF